MTSATQIPTVTFPAGHTMPMVGFGTWQLRGEEAYDSVRLALDAGYRHLDTAAFYRNEDRVGRAVRDSGISREDIFITTKMWPDSAGRERDALTGSLRSLGFDQVDLWLVHWPPNGAAAPQTWQQFIAARDDGLARTIDVSNYDTQQIDELINTTGEGPAVNQIPWSPAQHDPQLLADHRERGIAVTGYSSLRRTDLDHPALTAIADAHGVTPAQVVLRWHVEHGIVVIPRSTNPERISANLDLFGFSLDGDEMGRIDSLAGR
jgi:2,5-diketo-D-gluconate reductase A